MTRQKKLTAFTASYSQAAVVFPFIVIAPAYFSGAIQLGGMMQTASAFGSVQRALSFFVTAYRVLAEWQAVVLRLDGFNAGVAAARALASGDDAVGHATQTDASAITLRGLALRLPNGAPLVTADAMTFDNAARVLVTGPSGSGKSTLFRAIAGIWPFGRGLVTIPAQSRLMMLPQRPYFPVGALDTAVTYPAPADTIESARLAAVLRDVGLPALADRLGEHGHWNRTLSLGEQQRLGIARALIHEPDFLFLDEATASLDEPAEAAMYRLIAERLPKTSVISIGHRSTLAAFHKRQMTLVHNGDGHELRETAPTA